MIAVIFEVEIAPDQKPRYLDIAAALKPQLEQIEGFISVDRFQSLTDPDKILSLSFFENEEAVIAWRNLQTHRSAQTEGRAKVFKHYRLRVAGVIRDYGMIERAEAPTDGKKAHGG